jgi:hypothetical protein
MAYCEQMYSIFACYGLSYIHRYMGMYILVMEVTGLKAVLNTES